MHGPQGADSSQVVLKLRLQGPLSGNYDNKMVEFPMQEIIGHVHVA